MTGETGHDLPVTVSTLPDISSTGSILHGVAVVNKHPELTYIKLSICVDGLNVRQSNFVTLVYVYSMKYLSQILQLKFISLKKNSVVFCDNDIMFSS